MGLKLVEFICLILRTLDYDPTKEKFKESDRVLMIDDHEILHNTDETSVATTFTAEEETLFARRY